jgi:opacity protein-like surface antigen
MLNKIMMASLLFISNVSMAVAASFYAGPMLIYDGITAGNVSYQGLSPKLALGYGGTLKESPLYIAAELNAIPRSITLHNHRSGTVGLKPAYSVGASLLPGLYLDDVILAYLRLGVLYTRFDNLSVTRAGAQAGVGLQTHLSGPWDVRAEYVYTRYGSITGIGSPKTDQFGLGLIYHFA